MGTLCVFEMFGLCPYLKFDLIKYLSKKYGSSCTSNAWLLFAFNNLYVVFTVGAEPNLGFVPSGLFQFGFPFVELSNHLV